MTYTVGALYNRRREIHDIYGGQRQGGISTPPAAPFVFIFLGPAGAAHGYKDKVDDDGTLHYYGEGQRGDMVYRAGNKAIEEHVQRGKLLLAFQSLGHGKDYRFLGEYRRVSSYIDDTTLDTEGKRRKSIVFRLIPVGDAAALALPASADLDAATASDSSVETDAERTIRVRTRQGLFRRRVILVERGCRLSGLEDPRFLRASHIKPWSQCANSAERLDGINGLLMCPQGDHLFDGGWITFDECGRLVVSATLTSAVISSFGINLKSGRRCGMFNHAQLGYLAFHRENVFERCLKDVPSPRTV